ncbi:MAG: hypothetical protein IJ629_04365 [Clostridia bacterium]|nr:hypothetical protein [Clostridia bacterium]
MEKTKEKISENNLNIFPLYRALSVDFLFFYTINFLFLTQIKHLSASVAVLEDSFYALFTIIFQFPASLIVDKIGRKKGLILRKSFKCNLFNSIFIK